MRQTTHLTPIRVVALFIAALLSGAGLLGGGIAVAKDNPTPTAPASELAPQLPAVDLPTMNQQGFTFDLSSTFNGAMQSIPAQQPVYQLQQPKMDKDKVKDIAKEVSVKGDVDDQGGGTYSVKGDGGSLFVTPGLIQYVSTTKDSGDKLPSDVEAIAYAREWLRQTSLLPPDIGDGAVRSKVDTPARMIVLFKPVQPAPLLSDYPSITVTVGAKGTILEAAIRWASISTGENFQLRPISQAWDDVSGQRSYLNTQLPSGPYKAGASIKGKAVYTQVSIAYTSSGVPGQTQYLQPVYVFTGKLTPDGSKEAYPITAYVPALANSNQPVG